MAYLSVSGITQNGNQSVLIGFIALEEGITDDDANALIEKLLEHFVKNRQPSAFLLAPGIAIMHSMWACLTIILMK